MKKFVLFLSMFFVITLCSSRHNYKSFYHIINVDGSYFLILDDCQNTKIAIDEDVVDYMPYTEMAIVNPNKKIVVLDDEDLISLKFYFRKIVERNVSYIVYDDVNKRISFVELPRERREESSYLVIIGLVMILGMIIFTIFCRNKYSSFDINSFEFEFFLFIVAFISAIASFVNLFLLIFGSDPWYTCYLITVSSFSLYRALECIDFEKRYFYLYSALYYLSIIVYFGFLFLR